MKAKVEDSLLVADCDQPNLASLLVELYSKKSFPQPTSDTLPTIPENVRKYNLVAYSFSIMRYFSFLKPCVIFENCFASQFQINLSL